MKKKGHPPYHEVLFVDTATGDRFVCGSTLQCKEKEKFNGKEYPMHKIAISSKSHPFFTGSQQLVDAEGRVDKFTKKYANKKNEAAKAVELQKQKEEEQKEVKKTKKVATKKAAPSEVAEEKKAVEKKPAAPKTKKTKE